MENKKHGPADCVNPTGLLNDSIQRDYTTNNQYANGKVDSYAMILSWLQVLDHDGAGGIVEICQLDGAGPCGVGYFDDIQLAASTIEKLDKSSKDNFFVTLNPAKRSLLGRANNRVKQKSYKEKIERTKDHEIHADQWFFVDADPQRPSGISSMESELFSSLMVIQSIYAWLIECGVPAESILTAKSGNGAYLLVKTPATPLSKDHTDLKNRILIYLAGLFNTDIVSIDTSVANPARLIAAIGTVKRKGDSTVDRPHRRSEILFIGGSAYEKGRHYQLIPFDIYAALEPMIPDDKDIQDDTGTTKNKSLQQGRSKTGFNLLGSLDLLDNRKDSTGAFSYFNCPNCKGLQKFFVNTETGAWGCFHHNGGTCDHHDLAKKLFELCGNSADSAKSVNLTDNEKWEQPSTFHEYALPEFPIDSLPPWARDYAIALAEETQTPIDLPAMQALGVLSASVAGNVEIVARAGWLEGLNLFLNCILPPANRKSAVVAACSHPLEEVESNLAVEAAPEIAEAVSIREAIEERLKHLKKESAKKQNLNERQQILDEIKQVTRELQQINVPNPPRLLADDVTPEQLATLLADQGGRIAIISAEGDIFDNMAGRYSNGTPNLGVFLKGHAGDALRVDRRGRSEFVKRPALTISVSTQPEVICGVMSKSTFLGRGLLGRFLYSIPKSPLGRRKSRTSPVSFDTRSRFARSVKSMAGLTATINDRGEKESWIIRLSEDADEKLIAFQDEIEPRLADSGDLAMMRDWAGKLPGAVVRIAGILHMADNTGRYLAWPEEVSGHCMSRAITLGRYFIQHAQAAYAEMGADPNIEAAKYLLRWIDRWGETEFTKRQAFEGTKSRFKKVEALEPALKLLEDQGFIRTMARAVEERRGRKSSQLYEVNPLYTDASHKSHKSHNSSSAIYANSANNPVNQNSAFNEGIAIVDNEEYAVF